MVNPLEDPKNIKKGDILTSSWGYNATTNDYCKVLENTSKTIECQRIGKKKIGDIKPAFGSKVMPDKSKNICKPFRIRISRYKYDGQDEVALVGSYPTTDVTNDCDLKRRGNWRKWDGGPDIDTED